MAFHIHSLYVRSMQMSDQMYIYAVPLQPLLDEQHHMDEVDDLFLKTHVQMVTTLVVIMMMTVVM